MVLIDDAHHKVSPSKSAILPNTVQLALFSQAKGGSSAHKVLRVVVS